MWVLQKEVEIVEARLSVPFLSDEQVVDDRRVFAGRVHPFPIRQIILCGHDSSVFENKPRRSRVIGYDVVLIVAVADETDDAFEGRKCKWSNSSSVEETIGRGTFC